MKSFKEYLIDQELVEEKLITFGGKAYPKFGNVVLLLGSAGAGKGFIISNLLGIDGKILDVDAIKKLAMKSTKLAQRIKEETGHDIKNFDLKNPDNVSKIHVLLSDVYGITKASEKNFFASVLTSNHERKPNIVFDTTLKDIGKLKTITDSVKELGYDPKNIHLVWVMNKFEVAVQQNAKRDRVVPQEIMFATAEGSALTMRKIVGMGAEIKKYLDGDIYIAFNQKGEDSTYVVNQEPQKGTVLKSKEKSKGAYIKKVNYIQLKKKGKSPENERALTNELLKKIQAYVPKTDTWDFYPEDK